MGLKAIGRLTLAILLGATAWLAATAAPQRAPAPGAETTNWLATHSLAIDHDELFVDADAGRFRAVFGEGPQGVRTDPHGGRLEAPYLATRAWSWALAVAGERGPFLLNALAFALAAVAGCRALTAALGAAAPLWIGLLLYGSVAFTAVFRWQSEVLVFAAVVVAGALVWGREAPTVVDRGPDQIYGGDLRARAALWPWPIAGLLVGAAAVRHPAYLLIALPMLIDLPPAAHAAGPGHGDVKGGQRGGGRWRAGALFVLPLLLPLGCVFALQGAPWEAPATLFHPALLGWNVLYLAVGRNAGLLVGFLPVVVLLLSARQTGGRRYLPLVVGLAAVAQLLLGFVRAIVDEVDACWFTVSPDNAAARALHATLGAREVASVLDYYGPGDRRILSCIDAARFDALRSRYQRLGLVGPRAVEHTPATQGRDQIMGQLGAAS